MKQTIWTVAEAKARLSEVSDQALCSGATDDYSQWPCHCHRCLQRRVGAQDQRVGNLAEFLRPLRCAVLSWISNACRIGRARAAACEFSAGYQCGLGVGQARPHLGVITWLAEADEDRVF